VAHTHDGRSDSLTRWLLRGGLAAGPLFAVAFTIDGAIRPGYRPLRHPVSSLSLGPQGRRQVANFTTAGTLYLAGAAGLLRAAGAPAGTGLAGATAAGLTAAGLLGAAAFPTDPVSGYPPGSPDITRPPTRTGLAHTLLSAGVFLGIPAGALAASARAFRDGRPAWGLYCAGTATSMLATMAAAGAGFGQSPRWASRAGLFQRLSIATGLTWLTAVSAQALQQVPGRGRP
jgi:hypothetical protein